MKSQNFSWGMFAPSYYEFEDCKQNDRMNIKCFFQFCIIYPNPTNDRIYLHWIHGFVKDSFSFPFGSTSIKLEPFHTNINMGLVTFICIRCIYGNIALNRNWNLCSSKYDYVLVVWGLGIVESLYKINPYIWMPFYE